VRQQGIIRPTLDYSEDHLKIAQHVPGIAQLCLHTSIRQFFQPRRSPIGPIYCRLRAGWSLRVRLLPDCWRSMSLRFPSLYGNMHHIQSNAAVVSLPLASLPPKLPLKLEGL
jgi:hypothetical protein